METQDNRPTETKRNASPADYLANERTFLAWIRTGIATMAFGFVVVKFALFIKQIAAVMGEVPLLPSRGYSATIGVALVALGTLVCLLAFLRYLQIDRELNNKAFKSKYTLTFALTLTMLVVGVLLVLYLVD